MEQVSRASHRRFKEGERLAGFALVCAEGASGLEFARLDWSNRGVMFGTLGGPELLLIFVIALIVFGPRKLPEIGKSVGKMMAEFRKASNDFKQTIESEVEAEKLREAVRVDPYVPLPPSSAARRPVRPPERGDGAPHTDCRARPPEHGDTAVAHRRLDRSPELEPAEPRRKTLAAAPRRASLGPPPEPHSPDAAHHRASPDDRLRPDAPILKAYRTREPVSPLPSTPPDRMTFLEHLEELRQRLLRSIIALAVGFGVCWGFHEQIFHFLTEPLRRIGLQGPVHLHEPGRGADALHEDVLLHRHLRGGALHPLPDLGLHRARSLCPRAHLGRPLHHRGIGSSSSAARPSATTTSSPPPSASSASSAAPTCASCRRIGEYYSFYSWFILGLGHRLPDPRRDLHPGAHRTRDTPSFLLRGWKFAIVGSFVASAIITPTPDVVTQSMLAAPMIGLYLLGILVAWALRPPPAELGGADAPSESGRS